MQNFYLYSNVNKEKTCIKFISNNSHFKVKKGIYFEN